MRTPLLALAAGLALAGCNPGPVNPGLESVNQPVVRRTDYAFDLARGPGGLARGEAARLDAWFGALGLAYGDSIAVDDASGGGDARDAVAQVAGRYGLLLARTAPAVPGMAAPGLIRVTVSRAVAEVPRCPNWDRRAIPEYAYSTMSNFGCATNANLAAMVADPQDLIVGRNGGAGTDAVAATRALNAYRDAAASGANYAIKAESAKGSN